MFKIASRALNCDITANEELFKVMFVLYYVVTITL